jgi:hypothetical protein
MNAKILMISLFAALVAAGVPKSNVLVKDEILPDDRDPSPEKVSDPSLPLFL